MTSLPPKELKSEQKVVKFFDTYFKSQLEFPANDFDAVVGFFTKRGFDKISALAVAQVILTQSKIDNVKVFKVLDTLQGLNSVDLSKIVRKIINLSRDNTSRLGSKVPNSTIVDTRNIIL